MSTTTNLIHIVFATRKRHRAIDRPHEEDLYRFIWKLLKEEKCRLLRINGMPDHVHMLIDLAPTISLSSMMQKLKRQSSDWMKKCGLFNNPIASTIGPYGIEKNM